MSDFAHFVRCHLQLQKVWLAWSMRNPATRTRASYYVPTSTYNHATMQRSFGEEISGNCGRGEELLSVTRLAIISQHKAGVLRQELAAEFGCLLGCIYRIIKRWK